MWRIRAHLNRRLNSSGTTTIITITTNNNNILLRLLNPNINLSKIPTVTRLSFSFIILSSRGLPRFLLIQWPDRSGM